MLRVVVADDEERICRLILALGEWQRLGLEVVGTAGNGPDALEMVRTLAADILITDIRMPGCDGLRVVEEARRLVPELEVIVISGYAQFDYAQTAIRFGVGEYLLKPINREALNQSLEKMAERCRMRQHKETDMQTLRERQGDDGRQLRQKLVDDLLNDRLEADDAQAMERVYHFAATGDCYRLLMLKMDYDPENFGESSLSVVRDKVENLFQPLMSAVCADAVLAFSDTVMTGVLSLCQKRQEELRQNLRAGLNRLVGEKSLFGPVEFSLALGGPCAAPGELTQQVSRVQNLLAERLTEGTGHLLEGEAGKSGLLEMDFQARYTVAAAHAMDVMNPEAADAAATILEEAATVPGARGWELLALTRMAGLMFVTRLNADDSDATLAAFYRGLSQCGAAAELFRRLRELQREQIARSEQRLRDRDAQPIRNAKLYIQRNFSRPITLEEVAAAIGFSVNYFSTLFKKETGEGFAKYLTRVRMDEARALLRDTSRSVTDICNAVGYSDNKHFTHTFKAETGLTPGEYRKLYG